MASADKAGIRGPSHAYCPAFRQHAPLVYALRIRVLNESVVASAGYASISGSTHAGCPGLGQHFLG